MNKQVAFIFVVLLAYDACCLGYITICIALYGFYCAVEPNLIIIWAEVVLVLLPVPFILKFWRDAK